MDWTCRACWDKGLRPSDRAWDGVGFSEVPKDEDEQVARTPITADDSCERCGGTGFRRASFAIHFSGKLLCSCVHAKQPPEPEGVDWRDVVEKESFCEADQSMLDTGADD